MRKSEVSSHSVVCWGSACKGNFSAPGWPSAKATLVPPLNVSADAQPTLKAFGNLIALQIRRKTEYAVQAHAVRANTRHHAMAVRANMRSILVAMMKSFSCSPLIFLVCKETVALPQPKLIFG